MQCEAGEAGGARLVVGRLRIGDSGGKAHVGQKGCVVYRVVSGAAGGIEGVGRLHNLDVELYVFGLLLSNHDWVDQVEVQHDDDLLLRRLRA